MRVFLDSEKLESRPDIKIRYYKLKPKKEMDLDPCWKLSGGAEKRFAISAKFRFNQL